MDSRSVSFTIMIPIPISEYPLISPTLFPYCLYLPLIPSHALFLLNMDVIHATLAM